MEKNGQKQKQSAAFSQNNLLEKASIKPISNLELKTTIDKLRKQTQDRVIQKK
jgi:hypothetical protein